MVWFIGFISLFVPRLVIFCTWIFSSWFANVFQTWYWPFLGFLCMPHTLIWYSAVHNLFGGRWEFPQIFALVIFILMDISGGGLHFRKHFR